MTYETWVAPILAKASGFMTEVLNRADAVQSGTVPLAVTGLSRAGKTVFTTSLIHNLLSAAHSPARMPLLDVVGSGRLLAARLDRAGAQALPRFGYTGNIETMAEAMGWPEPTTGLSETVIEIRFVPGNLAGRMLGQVTGTPGAILLHIVDYPGEWLLDLPLLTQSYEQWSRATLRLMRRGVRAEAAGEFLAFIGGHRYDETAADDVAREAHGLYCAYLARARDQHGLTFLQPGRFLVRGELQSEQPVLQFAPMDIPEGAALRAGDIGRLMSDRFETYKASVVRPFYENHFRRLSRQIVLVDVLSALLAGREAFEDTRLALDAILQSFRYGSGSILSKLIGGAHVDKVLFAATKADHVPDIQRDHLAELLRNMVAFPAIEAKSANARFDVMSLASVISTAEETQEIDGQRVQVVVGRPVGSHKRSKFFVGTIPIRPPRPDAWGTPFLNVPVFEPPAIEASPVDGIPHINLDLALEFLLGDRLR